MRGTLCHLPKRLGLLAAVVGLAVFGLMGTIPSYHDIAGNLAASGRGLRLLLESDGNGGERIVSQFGGTRRLVRGSRHFAKQLRIGAFGSSNTWGAGLEDKYDGFPYLLSKDVTNHALFSAGPNYPAVCTQSMVGEDAMYDVILLEYWLRAFEGLPELARRLRNRFPDAIMVFLRMWGPFHARRKSSDDVVMNFEEWKSTLTFENGGQLNELTQKLEADDAEWYWVDHERADTLISQTIHDVQGYRIHFPRDPTCKETLIHYLKFFDKKDQKRLNERGHELIANLTSEIIHYHHRHHSASDISNSAADHTGDWSGGDSCHLWLTGGGCKHAHSDNFQMVEFDPKVHKWGLQINGEGWIDIENKFNEKRELHLSFMTSKDGEFPNVKVTYTADGQDHEYTLEPVHSLDRLIGPVRTVSVGYLPAATTTRLTLKPEDDTHASPLLLVGTTFSNGVVKPLEHDFGMVYNQ